MDEHRKPDASDDGSQAADGPVLTETVRDPESGKRAAEQIEEKGEPAGGGNFA